MPGLNGTGPNGMGPLTGGQRGFCAGSRGWYDPYNAAPRPLRLRRRLHRFFGWNRGWAGYQPPYPAYYQPEDTTAEADRALAKKDLEYQYEMLNQELQSVKKQLDALQNEQKEEQ